MTRLVRAIVVPFPPADALERGKWAAKQIGLTVRDEWPSGFRASTGAFKAWPYTLQLDVTENEGGSAIAVVISMAKFGVEARLEDRWGSFSSLLSAPFG